MRLANKYFIYVSILCASITPVVHAEYCIDWSASLAAMIKKHGGSASQCWATEAQCNQYYISQKYDSVHQFDIGRSCYYKPGLYPPTSVKKKASTTLNKTKNSTLNHESNLKQEEEDQFNQQKENNQLLSQLQGVPKSTPLNQIDLKAPPPAGGLARSQLDCIGHKNANESWETRAKDCASIIPNVPNPNAPVEISESIKADPVLLQKILDSIKRNITQSQNSIKQQDKTIDTLKQQIVDEEKKSKDANTTQSDAMKRALEQLAKAKADRERTAQELARLEKQEQDAKNASAPTK